MASRYQSNISAIQRRDAAKKTAEEQREGWKTREGGIKSDIYDNLGERDKERVAKLGGHIPNWAGKSSHAIGFAANLPEYVRRGDRLTDGGKPNNLIESAAWEMGYGNVKDEETFQKVLTEIEDQGFTDFDSQQDVHRFRENWTKKMIQEHAPKPEEPKEEEAKAEVKSEPSEALNKARAFVGQQNYEQQEGATTAAKFGTPSAETGAAQAEQELPGIKLGQASSFAEKYKQGVKNNLVPTSGTNTSEAIANAAKSGLGPDTQKATDPRTTWGADKGYLNTKKNPGGFW